MKDLKTLNLTELTAELTSAGYPKFRARQIFSWLHNKLVTSFDEMTNLPTNMRTTLSDHFSITTLNIAEKNRSVDGSIKYLFALADDNCIETVFMPENDRATVCVSSQVGCAYGCTFCATGKGGLIRNLTAAEIIDQVYRVQTDTGMRISNIVFMGMGEPLANYDAVIKAVYLLIDPEGLNISQRHITISTVGLIPGILKLKDEALGVNLAVSIHSPMQAIREKIVPVAKLFPLNELFKTIRGYFHATSRKITIEYTIVPGENDRPEDANAMQGWIRGFPVLVNLIPLNSDEEGARPPLQEAKKFVELLKENGLDAHVRKSRGNDIKGACGQLRKRYLKNHTQGEDNV
jgi:23S rRNA (adenine2503-C2)-methyltransferase